MASGSARQWVAFILLGSRFGKLDVFPVLLSILMIESEYPFLLYKQPEL